MICLLSALLSLGLSAAPSPASYERLVPPREMSGPETRVFLGVRHWVTQRQGTLRWDTRLAQVATGALAQDADAGMDLEALRAAAWRQGWTDGELSATRVRAAGQGLAAAVVQALQTQGGLPAAPRGGPRARPWVDMNRVGVAVRGNDALVLLSRRLVHWAPVPAQVEPRQEFMLVGRLSKSAAQVRQVRLAVAYPDGSVRSALLPVSQGMFEQRVHAGDQAGVLEVQALVDRGFGPEVASEMPVGVGQGPWAPAAAPSGAAQVAPSVPQTPAPTAAAAGGPLDDPARVRDALLQLVWGARAARGLSRPQLQTELAQAAQRHADEMQRLRYFAHVSPTGGDAVRRLAAQGVHERRVLENLAAAPTPDAAFAQWMNSPAHRANLLDADVSQMGLGTARGGSLLAVLLLAQPADSGTDAELTERALKRLNQARREQGWPPLREDLRLSAMAQRRCQRNAEAGALADSSLDVQAALDGSDGALHEAAADSYRSDSVDAVAQSPHVAEPFERVGIGVSQAPRGGGPGLWITVVYGA